MADTEASTPSYKVKVFNSANVFLDAYLEEAKQEELFVISSTNWNFNWRGFWENANFECEAIIKLHYQGEILGLIHFGLYPFPCDDQPKYVYIDHLECINREKRFINPVGFWLLWYAVKISLKYCTGDHQGSLVLLDSVEDAIPYYQDKVMMEGLGWITLAPGEDGYAFRFTKEGAERFCQRLEQQCGSPMSLS